MEFIKVGKNYMIKNGNGRIITEQEKLELENRELIIKDIQSNECQGKTTQKITKNKKKIKEMELTKKQIDLGKEIIKKELNKIMDGELKEHPFMKTALKKEESADETIEETDSTL